MGKNRDFSKFPNAITVLDNGNVGIGNSSPSTTLHISTANGIRLQYPGNTGYTQFSTDGTNAYIFSGYDGERMRITSAGNVGIGTSTPTRTLSIGSTSGSGTPVSSSSLTAIQLGSDFGNSTIGTNFKHILFKADSISDTYRYGLGVSDSLFEIVAGTGGAIGFFTNGATERMRISSSGNVGIGTSAYGYRLAVYNPSDGTTAAFGGAAYGIRIDNGGTFSSGMTTIFGVDNSFYGSYQPLRLAASTLLFSIGTDERMRITSAGYVGIGTTAPGAKVTIIKDSAFNTGDQGLRIKANDGDGYNLWLGASSNGYATIQSYQDNVGGKPLLLNPLNKGSVYIGATGMANGQTFGVVGNGVWDGATIGLQNTGTGGITYTIFSTNNSFGQGGSALLFYNVPDGRNNLILYANGNYDFAGSDVSDRRLKQDIEDINFGLNEIMMLSPKSYNLKSKDNLKGEDQTTLRKRYGFIAQEVQPILPDVITGEETETDYLGLDYNGVLAIAVKAIQELKAEIDILKNK